MSVTARAHPNIALIKYWGKRDEELILPVAGSLSLTLDSFATTTTVTLDESLSADEFTLGGAVQEGKALARVEKFMALVRERAAAGRPGGAPAAGSQATVGSHPTTTPFARISSVNEAPTGAGLASSASGFAALALAASAAYGLATDTVSLSRLARRGSGSACRSILPALSMWQAGTGDADSYARPVDGPDLAMVIVTVDGRQKAVSSREAMRITAKTSPYFPAWAATTEDSLTQMLAACEKRDFTRIGELTESHALRMHALIEASEPPIRYLRPASIATFDAVAALRGEGLEAYASADAGPNVAVLVEPANADTLARQLSEMVHGVKVHVTHAGAGAHLVPDTGAHPIPGPAEVLP